MSDKSKNNTVSILEVRERTAEELSKSFQDNSLEILDLRLRKTTGQVENTARIRSLRRENARIKTVIAERNNKK